jgi:RNA polymerase-binding transcription factor DksA
MAKKLKKQESVTEGVKGTISEPPQTNESEHSNLLLDTSSYEVMDEGDIAQINQLREIENIAHVAKNLNKPETFPGFDGCCIDCGVEIPKERLLLKKVRCVECQQDLEDAEKRRLGLSVHQTYVPVKIKRDNVEWSNDAPSEVEDEKEAED